MIKKDNEEKKREDEHNRPTEKRSAEESERMKRSPQRHSREPSDKRRRSESRSPQPCTSRSIAHRSTNRTGTSCLPARPSSAVNMVTASFTPEQMRRIREMLARDDRR